MADLQLAVDVASALDEVYEILAGDAVTHVNNESLVENEFYCVMEDYIRVGNEAYTVDAAGIRDTNIRTLTVWKSVLTDLGLVFSPSDWFLIDGERWDYNEKDNISNAIVPIAGVQNLIQIRLRKAVELNASSVEEEFTWVSE